VRGELIERELIERELIERELIVLNEQRLAVREVLLLQLLEPLWISLMLI
jgi:hypothetical protein